MQKKRWLYGSLSVLIVLCLILGTGAFVFSKRIPSVANQLASHDETTVLIISPDGSASYPADASIPISAMATSSQPMTAMELWVDGNLFATQSLGTDENASLFYKKWHWMPLVPGEHLLVVRAINHDGSVGTSNLVHLKVDKAAGFVLRHTTQPGETWESLTQSCDTSVETIAGQNPGFDPAAPLPVGKQVHPVRKHASPNSLFGTRDHASPDRATVFFPSLPTRQIWILAEQPVLTNLSASLCAGPHRRIEGLYRYTIGSRQLQG